MLRIISAVRDQVDLHNVMEQDWQHNTPESIGQPAIRDSDETITTPRPWPVKQQPTATVEDLTRQILNLERALSTVKQQLSRLTADKNMKQPK